MNPQLIWLWLSLLVSCSHLSLTLRTLCLFVSTSLRVNILDPNISLLTHITLPKNKWNVWEKGGASNAGKWVMMPGIAEPISKCLWPPAPPTPLNKSSTQKQKSPLPPHLTLNPGPSPSLTMLNSWERWRMNSFRPWNSIMKNKRGGQGSWNLQWPPGVLTQKDVLMSPFCRTNHVLTALSNKRTLQIPVKLSVNNQIINTTAIIDCGTTRNFINLKLISLAQFPLQWLDRLVKAYKVDGTTNSKGSIVWETNVDILFSYCKENVWLMVLNIGWWQIILGMPWLWKWNPQIDWSTKTLTIPWGIGRRNAAPLHECLSSWNETTIPQRYLLWWLGMDMELKTACRLKKWELWLARENIGKVTIFTQIAQETKVQEATLLDWYKDFKDVFSEKIHEKLLPHQSYDHVIDLKPTFTPKITKVYPLNPQEMETCNEFVKEHLRTGHIVPSKSPQASLFFFIPKKDGTLHPCQDYRYLNSHTIHDAYPLPLIPKLIDNMKDLTLFTKFDICWGYNNIGLQEEDQWKVAFITPLGLYELMVMFFGFSNTPPMFQAFMNHICTDIVTISFLSHVFFLVYVVHHPYFCFAPSYEEVDLYLLACPSYSDPFIVPL